MSLGLTEGTHYGSLNSNSQGALVEGRDGYGQPVGSSNAGLTFTTKKSLGVTTDPAKSGLIAKFSGLTLGTVKSKKLGSFYIRY